VLTCNVFICIMHRYMQEKNYVMSCVELHSSNEIMEPVDWRFSYRFCSRFKSSWKWYSVVGWVVPSRWSHCLQLQNQVVQEEPKHGVTRCVIFSSTIPSALMHLLIKTTWSFKMLGTTLTVTQHHIPQVWNPQSKENCML